jgi:uncharacterized protein HemY
MLASTAAAANHFCSLGQQQQAQMIPRSSKTKSWQHLLVQFGESLQTYQHSQQIQ